MCNEACDYAVSSSSRAVAVSSLCSSAVIRPTSSSNNFPYLNPKYKNTKHDFTDKKA